MYDERGYDRRERDYDDYDDSRPGRRREPPADDYPRDDDYRGPPPGGRAPAPPHPAPARGPPKPPRVKRPLGPTDIPKSMSLLVIIGIILMFVGLTLMTLSIPTTPPPEQPPEADPSHRDFDSDSSEYEEYGEKYQDWRNEYDNAERNTEMIRQIGIVIHYAGVMLAGIALVGGAMMLNHLDIKLRTALIVIGIVLVVVMYFLPIGWTYTNSL